MHIVILCATRRGYLFVQKLTEIAPVHRLTVFSFPEEPWEPKYLNDIRALTLAKGGNFLVAKSVGSQKWNNFWEDNPVDLMFAVSWRYMIPQRIYQKPRLGTYVFHDSLLPQYRGFSPTVWSIVNGEDHTGVTLFEIADGVDEGDIVAQTRVPIGPTDTISVVLEAVTEAYLSLLEQNLDNILHQEITSYSQDHSQATYTARRLPQDNQINWAASTESIVNLVRAVSQPYSGAFTYLFSQKVRIWSANYVPNENRYIGRVPGRVVEIRTGEGSVVLTGDGSLLIEDVQVEGSDIVCASEVINRLSYTLGK